MYVALLHQPDRAGYDTSALRTCISGGAALPVEVLRGFEEAFGVPVLEGKIQKRDIVVPADLTAP